MVICHVCHRGLTDDLARLPSLYDECGQQLSGGSHKPVGDVIPSRRLPETPFNVAAAEARAGIMSALSAWSGLVAQERSVGKPDRSARALANFLARHSAWLARHEAAAEASREVSELARAAIAAAYPDPSRRVGIGPCVEAGCDGSLTATVHSHDTLLPGEIRCDAERLHRWQVHEWLRLGRLLDRQRPLSQREWLSAENVSRLWRVPPGTVYRLASEQQWRRRRMAGHIYYHPGDVEQTFAARLAT